MINNSVVDMLKKSLADCYSLYLKTQNYHWNIEGVNFHQFHKMFEDQYKDLAEAIDTIAELIRGLGQKAPGTFEFYMKNTSITPGQENASARQMLEELIADNITLSGTLQQTLETAQEVGDEVVAGLMVDRLSAHRKVAWILKSSLST